MELVIEPSGWVAYFNTEPTVSKADLPGYVADRFALMTVFKDVEKVVGADQQQVRFVGANVGTFHLCLLT